jgi:hypothetical protein
MIQALWIDDENANSFMDLAYYKGINITKKENVDDGIEELLRDSAQYDAIILDANCICNQDNTKGPDIEALIYAINQLIKHNITQPWFVYSAGGFKGEDFIDRIVRSDKRPYHSEKLWYKKPKDMNLLFEDIKRVVAEYPDFKLKEKHAALFSWYPRKEELLNIIRYLDKEDNREDYEVFNKIRQELEFLMDLAHKKGFLDIEFKTTNLAACSQRLGDTRLTGIIPNYIQRNLHSAVSICNRGSHNTLLTDIVKENQAPYLIKSTIYEFLNLVHWFNKTEEEINAMKEQIKSALATDASELTEEEQIRVADKYQNKEYVVQKDQDDNYYCEECLLSYKKANPYLDQKVIIEEIKRNTSKTASLYPYFATFKTKEADENTSY